MFSGYLNLRIYFFIFTFFGMVGFWGGRKIVSRFLSGVGKLSFGSCQFECKRLSWSPCYLIRKQLELEVKGSAPVESLRAMSV